MCGFESHLAHGGGRPSQERSRFEERLAYQASHDSLTGLPNRFAVLEHLDEVTVRSQHEVAVLFVDLDSFKSVNDTRGHTAGDKVLVEVASRIARCVRDDEFVGRLGGDEFVVVVHDFVQVADLVALGHRTIREIELPHGDDQQIFALSASVQDDLDRLASLELALRHAIRNEELVAHLQSIVDLDTGHIGGAEALVRWARPGLGLVPPNDFIPVAERSGLIFELERWVLTRVCEHLAEWRRRDPCCHHRVAVNISGRHLIEGDLLADIDAALSLTGADPTMLELELTETHLLADVEQVTEVLEELRRRGITIAIDDFGTGYSSMTYLQHLPVEEAEPIMFEKPIVTLA